MIDDFILRAVIAGVGLALTAGPLGCVMVWRRMAYFGDTMAHSALLGVGLGLLLQINLGLAVFGIAVFVALALIGLQRRSTLPSDALLGILSHSTLAVGLVLVALISWVRFDLMGYLFGDILAVSKLDIAIIWLGGAAVLAILAVIWRPLIAATVSHDLAFVARLNPDRARLVYMLLLAAVIAAAMKIVGILLITSLLIIPAATARQFSRSPEQMAALASLIGALAVGLGLAGSLQADTPSGPSIIVAALVLFIVSLAFSRRDQATSQGGA